MGGGIEGARLCASGSHEAWKAGCSLQAAHPARAGRMSLIRVPTAMRVLYYNTNCGESLGQTPSAAL